MVLITFQTWTEKQNYLLWFFWLLENSIYWANEETPKVIAGVCKWKENCLTGDLKWEGLMLMRALPLSLKWNNICGPDHRCETKRTIADIIKMVVVLMEEMEKKKISGVCK